MDWTRMAKMSLTAMVMLRYVLLALKAGEF
jgi:hypothetical protein